MYWRFRHVTRNRLRVQNWMRRKRPATPYRPRATAATVYRHSSKRVWIALLVLVAILTLLGQAGSRYGLNPMLVYVLSAVVVIGSLYWAVRAL